MTIVPRRLAPEPAVQPPALLSPAETALYTRDILENLRKMAEKQGQMLLCHLLDMAAKEAKFLGTQSQQTRLPG